MTTIARKAYTTVYQIKKSMLSDCLRQERKSHSDMTQIFKVFVCTFA